MNARSVTTHQQLTWHGPNSPHTKAYDEYLLRALVNSTVQDGRPALSFDGTQLYFQSPRPGGLGSFDLYVTTRTKLQGPN